MKCAYCNENIESDPYQGLAGKSFVVEIRGIEAEVYLHRECIAKAIGECLTLRIEKDDEKKTRKERKEEAKRKMEKRQEGCVVLKGQ